MFRKVSKVSLPDRHEEILRVLELRERMTVGDLAERLDVSEVTVRKDLSSLEEQGQLIRTHGGARLAQDRRHFEPVDRRRSVQTDAKGAIARAAAGLVGGGETVFIDSGSTCLEVARRIAERDVRVITNSLDVLDVLAASPSVILYATGGSFRPDARSFIGPGATESVGRFHIDRAFLGTSGIGLDGVFSAQNTIESETKRAVIRQAARIAVVADASKVGQRAFSIFARPEDVHVLVTSLAGVDAGNAESVNELAANVPFEVLLAEDL